MATTLNQKTSGLGSIIAKHRDQILAEWLREMGGAIRRSDLIKESEMQSQCGRFIALLADATAQAGTTVQSAAYDPLRELLGDLSKSRAVQGFSARETAVFVFSIKRPIFTAIREELSKDPTAMAEEMWNATELLDGLGLYTTDA